MSVEDLYVEVARQKADIAKLTGRVEALEEFARRRDDMFKNKLEKIPKFDPKILTEHQWKGKKLGHRHWADGSLSWGWDFKEQFPAEVIEVLEKGDLTIDGYVFSLGDKVVNVKKESGK